MSVLRPALDEALAEWRARVTAHHATPRSVGLEERGDRWAGSVSTFRADPDRTDEPALDALRDLALPGETWLDIGAGAGRYALPLARVVGTVVAVEPSPSMGDALQDDARAHGIENVEVIRETWPPAGSPPVCDIALMAHVLYGAEDVEPFLDAAESAAGRLCVAFLFERAPASSADSFWPVVHGVERTSLPALPEFMVLQVARGRSCGVRLFPPPPRPEGGAGELGFLRRQLRVEPDTEADRRLRTELDARHARGESIEDYRGRLALVSWEPRAS